MDFKETLEKLKKEIDRELEKYLSQAILDVESQDKEAGRMLRHAAKIIMSGGKRLRPILMYFGYLAAGGTDRKRIIRASVGIELIHNFLLMHDDIIDHAKTRHGVETVDVLYYKIGSKNFSDCKNLKHLGDSMAILAGDLLEVLGIQAITAAGFEPGLTVKAVAALQSVIATTIVGQTQDIGIENRKAVKQAVVLEMYKNKTAKYTLESPLKIGAILAGTDAKFLQKISSFAIPVGIAFQIQDDILGLFGDSRKIGKAVGSDIQEGKKTLLILEALQKSKKAEKQFMQKILGQEEIKPEDIEKFQNIIRTTGALSFNQNLAKKLIAQGKTALEKVQMNSAAKRFLLNLADYMLMRNK